MEEFFEKITPRGTPVKYICCDNTGEHQSKSQRVCKKEKVTLEYMTPHTPQLNVVIEGEIFRYQGRSVSNAAKLETK